MGKKSLSLSDLKHLVYDAYLPLANEKRAIPWPKQPGRFENDAEHSFALSLIGGSIANELGLDANKASVFGIVHDLVEIYAGDTSVWDHEGLKTKKSKEAESLRTIKQEFTKFPWIADMIEEYEKLDSEEAKLIYSLDKIMPVLLIHYDNGFFWKQNAISYDQHHQKYLEKRKQVAMHPLALEWFDEIHEDLKKKRQSYFP